MDSISFHQTMISIILKHAARGGISQKLHGRLGAEPQIKEKLPSFTKISLNAFNGAERVVSLWWMPVKAPVEVTDGVSLRFQWAANGEA